MFTDEELKMIKFIVENDLETVSNELENEGSAEEWQYDKRILQSILGKIQ